MLDADWVPLARELNIGDSDINIIKSQYPENPPQQALVALRLWMQGAGNKATGNVLEKALRQINRVDIVNQCIFNVEPVTDVKERAVAKAQIDSSVVADSPHPIRKDRDVNLDVSDDGRDLGKDSRDVPEELDNQQTYPAEITQASAKMAQAADVSQTNVPSSMTAAGTVLTHETEPEAPVARDGEATAPASAAARVLDLEEAGTAEQDNSKATACREEIKVQSAAVGLEGTTPQADTTPIPLITPLIESSSSAESIPKKYPPTSKLKSMEDSGLLPAGMVDPSMNKNESIDYKPEEQDERLIMRDSPRWEEEEIKTEERQDPRIIKAEVKLLVRTTESGKETIEIRSIEEFVEIAEKFPGGFSENVASKSPDSDKLAPVEEKVFTLHRKSPARSPSPRFVRPLGIEEGSYISEATADEFNLMSQIRDIEGAPTSATTSKKKNKKKSKRENK